MRAARSMVGNRVRRDDAIGFAELRSVVVVLLCVVILNYSQAKYTCRWQEFVVKKLSPFACVKCLHELYCLVCDGDHSLI